MTNNSIKVLVLGLIALLLTYFNKAYSILIMLGLILIYVVNAYQLEKHYQRMGRFMQRERDNELKEVEIENKYHEKILSQLIRSMNLPMLFVNKEGKIAFTNQSFRKGFEIPHLKGRYYKDIFVGEMLDLVEQCYVFERPLSTVVKIQSRYYQVESSPVFSDHEKLIFDGTIVLFTDVSKMKEIEDMQKQFLSDVSHELKTPMSAIIGSVEILKRDGMESPEIFNEFMDILLKESYRMQNIINDILELSRLDQTKVSLDYQELDVKAVVKESMDLFEPLAKEKHLSLIYHNQIKEPLILDYSTVKTILSNFISNAIKYSNEGIITIKTKKEDDTFILSVQDEGIGIPKNKLNYIYDRFYQVDKSRSSKISTGLGLSIVKKIVELNQGTIDVESSAGIGSTFIVKLPINPKVSHNDDII
ncbi:sensor histidine kinase [Faecalibacillus faecis]|uniref:sensor histidine kinase n=1 Tax=Faecalibacillus faecis TaxID=1982628 RepID=UPI000E51CD79|nr:HAMP domain-containing sensor histidine kinase [Faecalibacillus faecis]RGT64131.1 GHKL domain-containing protein [Coprobacillus sp. AF18-40]RGT85868.1 GHKL domain-containing protein [Coprobacillus sp. AF18-15LB]RHP23873.1 GHKL domain-containing protein [Coprobacillus sp. AF34-1BH]RHQ85978.1 GHKL domain-containing protein [Coprobacillus sp. AF21-8LB]